MYLDNFTNDYAKMCMSAYCADYENFIKYYDVTKLIEIYYELDTEELQDYDEKYPSFSGTWEVLIAYEQLGGDYDKNKLNNFHLLTYILTYTCRHNFIFAYELRHSGLELNKLVYEAISASFIQHGYLDDYFIEVHKPLNIWYPKHPSKETCLKLLKLHDFYKYSVAYLSVIMGWEDIFIKSNIDCGFKDLFAVANFFIRHDIIHLLKKNPVIFKDVYSRSIIYTKYKKNKINSLKDDYNNFFMIFNFTDIRNYIETNKFINDDMFINYNYRIEYNTISANVINVTNLSLNNKILINNIRLPMSKKLTFNFPNKYVAYIGDIQYYQGGDFEYAKWGALNNSIFANYVINNKDKFPDFVIKNAVSNMLINRVIDEELVNTYKPFYFYNFISITDCEYNRLLMNKFPFLKINIMFGHVNGLISTYIIKDFLPDIDIISMILSNKKFVFCLNDLINQARKQGYYYKHLDFENECNYNEPKKIPFDSVNLDDLKNQPLSVFHEGLNFTEIGSVATSDPVSLTDFSKLQL